MSSNTIKPDIDGFYTLTFLLDLKSSLYLLLLVYIELYIWFLIKFKDIIFSESLLLCIE